MAQAYTFELLTHCKPSQTLTAPPEFRPQAVRGLEHTQDAENQGEAADSFKDLPVAYILTWSENLPGRLP